MEPNPAVKEWFEETKEAREYEKKRSTFSNFSSDVPSPPPTMIEKKMLETVVSDEEFQVIKKGCMDAM